MDAVGTGLAACISPALLLVLYVAVRRAARRRVNRGHAAYPTALAVTTGWIWVSETRSNGRSRVRQPRATLVLLPDRLVAEPTRGGTMVIPLSSLSSAAWDRIPRGRRTIAVLQLQPVNGSARVTPLLVDNVLGDETAEFATAVTDVLSRWLPNDRGPGQPPGFLVRSKKQRVTWTAATIGVATLPVPVVVGLTAVMGVSAGASSADAAIPRAPGYYTVHGPHGKPLTVGAPWGTPCAPTVVVTPRTLPGRVYRVIAATVHAAWADGVNIIVTHRNGNVPLTKLYPVPGSTWAHNVIVVPGGTSSNPSTPHSRLGWDAELTPDGQHEKLTYLQDIFYLTTLQQEPEPVTLRKVVRYMIGFSQGIGSSTRPRSAFDTHLADAADRFSPSDVHALLTMSGCAPYAPQR